MRKKFKTVGYIIAKHKIVGFVRKHGNGYFFYVPRTEDQCYRRSRLFYTENKVKREAQNFIARRYGVEPAVFFNTVQ